MSEKEKSLGPSLAPLSKPALEKTAAEGRRAILAAEMTLSDLAKTTGAKFIERPGPTENPPDKT